MTNRSNSTQDTEDVVARVNRRIDLLEQGDPRAATWVADFREILAERQSLSDRIDVLTQAVNVFVRSAYPVATEINERGHNWCEAYLDEALTIARAALHQEGIAP